MTNQPNPWRWLLPHKVNKPNSSITRNNHSLIFPLSPSSHNQNTFLNQVALFFSVPVHPSKQILHFISRLPRNIPPITLYSTTATTDTMWLVVSKIFESVSRFSIAKTNSSSLSLVTSSSLTVNSIPDVYRHQNLPQMVSSQPYIHLGFSSANPSTFL